MWRRSSLFSSSALSSDEHASTLSSAINGLSSSLWVDAQPGEEASTISTDNLKLSSQVNPQSQQYRMAEENQ